MMAQAMKKLIPEGKRSAWALPDGEQIEIVKIFLDNRFRSGYPPRFISDGPAPRG
jgi:hypothetical protein